MDVAAVFLMTRWLEWKATPAFGRSYKAVMIKRILIALFISSPVICAGPPPVFEVATVRPVADRSAVGSHELVEKDRLDFSNVTLETCLMRAYRLQNYQIIGPAWIRAERFVITAKAPGRATEDQILLMLQALLADRFGLAAHSETRLVKVLALVVSRNGAKIAEARGRGPTSVGPADSENKETAFRRVTIQQLALRLRRYVGLPIINETVLTGHYDFNLPLPVMTASGPQDLSATDPDYVPSIFTSLKERLGLEMKAKKSPVDVLVLDHVERPTAN